MAQAPRAYDDLCTYARQAAGAVAAIVIIVEGEHGNGFACESLEPELQRHLPTLLRRVAEAIEAENMAAAAREGH